MNAPLSAEKRVEDERYWVYRDSYHYPQLYCAPHPVRPSTEYVRVDLYDKAVAERDEAKQLAIRYANELRKQRA